MKIRLYVTEKGVIKMTREQTIYFLKNKPVEFAHMLGFAKLNELHNDWIIDMLRGKEDRTLQASRG